MNEIDSDALVLRADAPGIDAKVSSGSSLILQIDKGLGKQFLTVLWISAIISGFALAAIIILALVMMDALDDTTAHVNVLQYDLAQVKAQLIEKGLYEPTSH
jgi:hypothetical protein